MPLSTEVVVQSLVTYFHHLLNLENHLDQTGFSFVERCGCHDKSRDQTGRKAKMCFFGLVHIHTYRGWGHADIFQRLGFRFRLLVIVYL